MIKDIEFFLKNIFFSEKFLLEKRLKRAIKNNYEKELSIIGNFTDKNKEAVDVGVYRGVYTYKLSKEFKHVHAFEPNPLIYPFLEKNLTKIVKNMTLKNLALSDSNGDVNLRIPSRSKSIFKTNYEEIYKLGCATIHEGNKIDNKNNFKVKKIKLDDLLEDKNISFVKIDVEGHEREVITGSKKIIKKNKPVLLVEIEERHNNFPILDTIEFIKNFGYNSYFVADGNVKDVKKLKDINSENNFLFIAKK
jgi:FkbM family methyltransferase|tara:strand:- start:70 stop:816 length:747 start_codon:yes stop_codon:yes gene_type:complete